MGNEKSTTKKFMSLKPAGLPDEYDAAFHGESPFVEEPREIKDGIEIDFIFPGFSISHDEKDVDGQATPFMEIGMTDVGWLSESGKPLLPSFGRRVNVPVGCEVKISVKKGRAVRFEDILVTPAQENEMDEGGHELEFDSDFYSKEEYYPKDIAAITMEGELDGYNSCLVHVRPLQYNPAKKLLLGYSNITVTFKFMKDEDEDVLLPFVPSDLDKKAFGNFFLDPRRVTGITALEKHERIFPGKLVKFLDLPNFLIIYEDRFKKPAEALADWKRKKGIVTKTVDISKIGNDPTKIKDYIRKMRKPKFSRLRYVLLFGDVDHIVSEVVGSNRTDHYYFTPNNPTGTEYVMAWVAGGRIPLRTTEEGMTAVNQIIRYEKTPPSDHHYFRRILLSALFEDYSPMDGKDNKAYVQTMEKMRPHLEASGFEVDRIYTSTNPSIHTYKDGTAIPTDVLACIVDSTTATQLITDAVNEGYLVVGHRDHGTADGWHQPPFEIADLAGITTKMPSVFYSVNCQTGRFDLAGASECFAEAILNKDGAAPSLVAATRNSGTWRNDSMIKAMFDGMFSGVLATFPGTTASYPVKNNRLGDILNYGMSYLPIAHSGEISGIKAHTEIYHVVGDPTLEIWGREPLIMRMSTVVRKFCLFINFSTCPSGGYLSIWAGKRLIKDMHPQSMQVTIPLKELNMSNIWKELPFYRSYLTICFAKPGYRFATKRIKMPFMPIVAHPVIR